MLRPARLLPWALALVPPLLACTTSVIDYASDGGCAAGSGCSTGDVQPDTSDDVGSSAATDDTGPPPGPGGPPNPTDATDADDDDDVTSASTSTGAVNDDDATDTSSTTDASPPQEDTSTGDAPADAYAPCESDDECASGLCLHGFCTSICWSFVEGQTPCPPAPADAPGVEIVCGTITHPAPSGICTVCGDCSAYCIATCVADSDCPSGSTCRTAACTATNYCGGPVPENTNSRCANGQDDDDDGFVDCDDFDCSMDPDVTVCA
jgi:hypothetical protein